jgi:hypothetical protein
MSCLWGEDTGKRKKLGRYLYGMFDSLWIEQQGILLYRFGDIEAREKS